MSAPAARLAATESAAPASWHRLRPHGRVWWVYGVMTALLLAYLVSLIVRPADDSSTLIDGWAVAGCEIVVGALAVAAGFVRGRVRPVPILLGASLLAWASGDVAQTVESLGGAEPPVPSVADAFYLVFYALAYVGLVLFIRGEVRKLSMPNWLDGAVAGLGASAVCAAFAFKALQHSTGEGALAVAVNTAYPVGDLLLLMLVVGGTVLLAGRSRAPWLVIATGITVNVVGDTFNLLQPNSHLGVVMDGIAWPAAILLLSMAMWLPRGHSDPLAVPKPTGMFLPGLAASAGIVILFIDTAGEVNKVAVGLATATLMFVCVRMSTSARALRFLTEERQRQSVTDHLTGLGNRRRLFDMLDAFFAEHADAEVKRNLAFLFIDLDHFKQVNDSFGHPAGDQILKQLGERLMSSLTPADLLVRLGGDEFAAVLVDADADRAEQVAASISRSFDLPFTFDALRAELGASIGIALAPAHATDSHSLIWCADVAMYRAKLARSPFALFDREFDNGGNRLRLAEELDNAVEHDELVLHYQPQLDPQTGEVSTVEALLRWPHPELGLMEPAKFLPLAEEAGLMGALTRWVLEHAIAQAAAWRAAGRDLKVSVNVSASDLTNKGLAPMIAELLERHGVPGDSLVIEITETNMITDFERSKAVVDEIHALGAVVSIDDFGAGFTSLAYLSNLAIQELKLDRSLITKLAAGERERDVELVRATIALGHALRLRVVAEGIEDPHTLQRLSELGCDLAQGYFIGRPKPAADIPAREAAPQQPARAKGAPRRRPGGENGQGPAGAGKRGAAQSRSPTP